ncbi:hypothetical protein [Tenggerimyces flavus]|uniref:Uncharacterized protein n=1 Tax=Tenggerimyces flavus TaxID=1708749 RepID=A0ABV7YA47_9ACTN|nr:hypothetical protein [Tenggerimyces flavus]MBM7788842.1 hypothetical protein [Tenggerimyces flavus]
MDHPQKSRDPLVELVEKRLANGADAQKIVVEVLRSLAEQLPVHYGPEAQPTYRRFLRRRAELVEEGAPWVKPFLAESWQWQ